jgi:hypothetical protein
VRIAAHAKRHPRERLAYMQQWRKEHPERVREYQRRSAANRRRDARQLAMGF